MNETSFIKVPKELFYSDIHKNKELFHFTVTLLSITRFSPIEIDSITVMPGQILTTGAYLCELCDISRGKMRNHLKTLCDYGFISKKAIGHKYTLITVHKDINAPRILNGVRC